MRPSGEGLAILSPAGEGRSSPRGRGAYAHAEARRLRAV
jgi:hypothetical protein